MSAGCCPAGRARALASQLCGCWPRASALCRHSGRCPRRPGPGSSLSYKQTALGVHTWNRYGAGHTGLWGRGRWSKAEQSSWTGRALLRDWARWAARPRSRSRVPARPWSGTGTGLGLDSAVRRGPRPRPAHARATARDLAWGSSNSLGSTAQVSWLHAADTAIGIWASWPALKSRRRGAAGSLRRRAGWPGCVWLRSTVARGTGGTVRSRQRHRRSVQGAAVPRHDRHGHVQRPGQASERLAGPATRHAPARHRAHGRRQRPDPAPTTAQSQSRPAETAREPTRRARPPGPPSPGHLSAQGRPRPAGTGLTRQHSAAGQPSRSPDSATSDPRPPGPTPLDSPDTTPACFSGDSSRGSRTVPPAPDIGPATTCSGPRQRVGSQTGWRD